MCSRYPGRRPSDYYGELDDYEAFQLDVGMAMRGQIEDRDYDAQVLHVLLDGMTGIMRSNGAKVDRLKPPKRTVVEAPEGDPDLSDLLDFLGGNGTVING